MCGSHSCKEDAGRSHRHIEDEVADIDSVIRDACRKRTRIPDVCTVLIQNGCPGVLMANVYRRPHTRVMGSFNTVNQIRRRKQVENVEGVLNRNGCGRRRGGSRGGCGARAS